MKLVQILIEEYNLQYPINEAIDFGNEEILIDNDDNIIKEVSWGRDGFTIAPFISSNEFRALLTGIEEIILTNIRKTIGRLNSEFKLEKYHEFIRNDELHNQCLKGLRNGIIMDDLPIDVEIIEKSISQICGVRLSSINPKTTTQGFFIRIVRPNSKNDNNPPHKDVWLEHLRNAINIYAPLAGSNLDSSLPLISGSHYWKESEIERTLTGSTLGRATYKVPAVTGSIRKLVMKRPNPKLNEVLVFSPYLIHGGAVNLNKDITRISLEMRFWRKPT